MQFPSQLIEEAVNEVAKLPGIGKKTALRLVLHLLKQEQSSTEELTTALLKMRREIKYCKHCFNIADAESCSICNSHKRDRSLICVVEDSRDVLAIENTAQYNGLYHVLGGVISPVEGIGPSELKIDQLVERVKNSEGEVKELIFALSPTMEGDTTAFYLVKKLKAFAIKLSTIARGIAIGSELEYTDEVTLGRSILSRTHYD